MTVALIVVGVVLWLATGALARAMCFGDFFRFREVAHSPNVLATFLFVVGPLGLLTALMMAERPYKLLWRGWTDEYWDEDWKEYKRQQRAA